MSFCSCHSSTEPGPMQSFLRTRQGFLSDLGPSLSSAGSTFSSSTGVLALVHRLAGEPCAGIAAYWQPDLQQTAHRRQSGGWIACREAVTRGHRYACEPDLGVRRRERTYPCASRGCLLEAAVPTSLRRPTWPRRSRCRPTGSAAGDFRWLRAGCCRDLQLADRSQAP